MISTDLHGNGEDFRQLRGHFLEHRARDPRTHWVILGDLVHAPGEDARQEEPRLYYFEDESWNIVVCPVIFGAPRENKRYLTLNLADRYRGPADIRDGVEIQRLY